MRPHFSAAVSPGLAGYDTTIGSDQDVLRNAPGDIGVSDLQPVDRVGEVNAVFGAEEPATGNVTDEIGNRTRTDFWTFESLSAVAFLDQATEEDGADALVRP